jgi:hypothetical protein
MSDGQSRRDKDVKSELSTVIGRHRDAAEPARIDQAIFSARWRGEKFDNVLSPRRTLEQTRHSRPRPI